MRTAVLFAVSALTMSALAIAGCDTKNPLAKKAEPPAAPAPAAQAAPPPAPEATPAPAVDTTAPAAAIAAAAAPAPATAPAAPQVVRWSRADYAKREARLAALIANAETRDTTGETQRRAEEGRYRRAHCTTKACIESSYAAEEAWLKQWESSGG